jgi:transcriptional regulator with XRE-family HTH domain
MSRPSERVLLGRTRGDGLRRALGNELRLARRSAGLSIASVAAASGCSAAEVWRIEHASASWLSIQRAAVIGSVLGLELTARCYPAGSPLRDAAHLALIGRLRPHVASWHVTLEAPIPIPGDPRSIDIVLSSAAGRIGVEAETALLDLQALLREMQRKQRDGGLDRMILLILRSRRNRDAMRSATPALTDAFPTPARAVLSALRSGRLPPGNGIVSL